MSNETQINQKGGKGGTRSTETCGTRRRTFQEGVERGKAGVSVESLESTYSVRNHWDKSVFNISGVTLAFYH